MKRTLLFFVLIVFFTTSFIYLVGCNNQPPTKEQNSVSENKIKVDYELQEQCGKRCEEWFKKEYEGRKCFHTNHYNKKMNKCLILVVCSEGGVQNQIVLNVNESKKIGGFSDFGQGLVLCSMLGKECKSKEEWDSLVKPYMEE